MHTISATMVYVGESFGCMRESLRIFVNLQFLNGICLRYGSPSADMH